MDTCLSVSCTECTPEEVKSCEKRLTNIPYGEIEIGQIATWTIKTTDRDIQLGALYSGDWNSAHLDDVYAGGTFFKKRILHGLWTLGKVSAILGTDLPGLGTIFLNESVSYRGAVFIGDEITITLTVKSKAVDPKLGHVVNFDILATNQNGKKILVGECQATARTDKIYAPCRKPTVKAEYETREDWKHADIQTLVASLKAFGGGVPR